MKNDDLIQADDLQIEALSDEELETVAGGHPERTNADSCTCCTSGAITIINGNDE